MRLLLTGGGTGGHIYPAVAIAEACAREPSLAPLCASFIGSRRGLEARIVPAASLRIAFVSAAPFERGAPIALLRTIALNALGFLRALVLVRGLRPDVLVATGGYVTFPVVAALRCLRALGLTRARIAVLEANATPGLTNRLLAPLADEVWWAHRPPEAMGARAVLTGMPVRASLRVPLTRTAARQMLGLEAEAVTIVVMGGSQGARSLNAAVAAMIEAGFPAHWQIALVSGKREYETLALRLGGRARVRVFAYLDDPRAAYAAADIVVVRSGASTLGELAATGTPAILVPYPHATDDHQMRNARAYAAGGAAIVLPDADLNAARLQHELQAALEPARLEPLRVAARAAAIDDPAAAIAARVKLLISANGNAA